MYWMKPAPLHKSLPQLPWALQNPKFLGCIKMASVCHMVFPGARGEAQSLLARDAASNSSQRWMPGEQYGRQVRAWVVSTWLWSPSFWQSLFPALLEKGEAQRLIPLPDLSSINVSNHFLISFGLLTSVLLGGNEFCNSLHVLWKSISSFLLLLLNLPSGNFYGFSLCSCLMKSSK